MYTVIIQTHRGAGTPISIASIPGFATERRADQAGRQAVLLVESENGYASFVVVQAS